MTTMTIRTRAYTSEQTSVIQADARPAAQIIRDAMHALAALRNEVERSTGNENLNPEMWQERLSQIFATLPTEAMGRLAEMSAAAAEPMRYQAIAHLDEAADLDEAEAYFFQHGWHFFSRDETSITYHYIYGSHKPVVTLFVGDGQVKSVGLRNAEQRLIDWLAGRDGESLIAVIAQSVGRNR